MKIKYISQVKSHTQNYGSKLYMVDWDSGKEGSRIEGGRAGGIIESSSFSSSSSSSPSLIEGRPGGSDGDGDGDGDGGALRDERPSV